MRFPGAVGAGGGGRVSGGERRFGEGLTQGLGLGGNGGECGLGELAAEMHGEEVSLGEDGRNRGLAFALRCDQDPACLPPSSPLSPSTFWPPCLCTKGCLSRVSLRHFPRGLCWGVRHWDPSPPPPLPPSQLLKGYCCSLLSGGDS